MALLDDESLRRYFREWRPGKSNARRWKEGRIRQGLLGQVDTWLRGVGVAWRAELGQLAR